MMLRKQVIELRHLELEALWLAIDEYLHRHLPEGYRPGPIEILSIQPLRRLRSKLFNRWQIQEQKPFKKPLKITLSPEELIAVHYCIKENNDAQYQLRIAIGVVQQKVV